MATSTATAPRPTPPRPADAAPAASAAASAAAAAAEAVASLYRTHVSAADAAAEAATAAAQLAAAEAAAAAAAAAAATAPPEVTSLGAIASLLSAALTGARVVLTSLGGAAAARPLATLVLSGCVAAYATVTALFGRIFRIYGVAISVILAYVFLSKVALRATAALFGTTDAFEDALYSWAHRRIAPRVCAQLVSLRSVFVKFGQYIGGRTDMVPPEWAAELKQLQDDLPACRRRYVDAAVRDAFGRRIADLFSEFAYTPIASASVAQVHVARVRDGGAPVVVKVQHEGVDPLMRKDMVAARRIAKLIAWIDRRFATFHTVMQAWEGEMYKELDFRVEAANLEEVEINLRRAAMPAVVPRPLATLTAQRVFAMSYEEGFKVTDEEALAAHGVDREALMVRVVQVYAQQLFVDGFFNADPHAGNLMVQVRGGVAEPVLLDFGMTVRLSERQRLGYARLALSAQQMDLCGIIAAVGSLGVKTNQTGSDPARDLEFWRFFLRDTGTRDEARKQSSDFFKTRAAQREQDKREGRDERRLDEIPPDLIFFWRVIGLLRGLCTSLHVRVPYMELLAARAKLALASLTPPPLRALALAPPAVRLPHALPLHAKLASLLAALASEGGVGAGVQVCVQRGDTTLAEAAAGFRGQVDARPVEASTPMPLLELSALLPVLAVHALARRGALKYDQTIASLWPAFGQNGKAGVTVRQALTHRVALRLASGAWLRPPRQLADLRARLAEVAAAPLADGAAAAAAGPRASGLVHGWVLAGICEGAMGAPYCQVVHELLVDAYGVTGQLWPGELPPPVAADAASVSTGFAAALATVLPSGGGGEGGGLGFGTPGGAAAASPAPNGLNGLNGEKATPGHAGDARRRPGRGGGQGVRARAADERWDGERARGARRRRPLLRRLWLGALALRAPRRGGARRPRAGGRARQRRRRRRGVGALWRAAVGPRAAVVRVRRRRRARGGGAALVWRRDGLLRAAREGGGGAAHERLPAGVFDDAPRAEPDLEGAAHREGRVRGGWAVLDARAWARASM